MTTTYGQIECLKRIRSTLDQYGITRFNSIGAIKSFLKNYEHEKEELFFKIERDFDLELDTLQNKSFQLKKAYEELKNRKTQELADHINSLKTQCAQLSSSNGKSALMEFLHWYPLQILLAYTYLLEKNFKTLIQLQTRNNRASLNVCLEQINSFSSNRQSLISERFSHQFSTLAQTKTVADGLYTLMAGAIGENLVAKELEKLPRDNVLINDFSLTFKNPIYNKKTRDRICSIQIDHLLVAPAGIFIIETKNWSKASIERHDLRSPIKQIRRASFALFSILNSENTAHSVLKPHHWGQRKIPVNNIVAMIHHKPKERFKHVAIKKLKELNGYIEYFEPILDKSEVYEIADYLLEMRK